MNPNLEGGILVNMATTTLNIPLPEDLKRYVDARVDSGAYGTPSDYVRELILNDRDRRLSRLEDSLVEALKGEPIEITDEEWAHGDIMAIAEQRLSQRQ